MKVLINGRIRDLADFNPDMDTSEEYIYEVIRIIDGAPLFAREHYDRLTRSLEISGREIVFSYEELCQLMDQLATACGNTNDNVEVIIDNFRGPRDYDTLLFMLGAHYPTADMYADGVATELFSAVRDNPHMKIRNRSLREATNAVIEEHGLFEVILVDAAGNITEGSRSNIFFIKDDHVYTSPSGGVLLGVTRQKIIEICHASSIDVEEVDIPANAIGDFDAAFISGTSPKVLPIARIGQVSLNVNNSLLRRIMVLFDEAI